MTAESSRALDFPISGAGPLSQAVRLRGYRQFVDVADAVRALPYGRVGNSDDVLAVIEEGKGTCSSKHRFLAALAHECGHTEVQLVLGLYEMSEQNTPGVGNVLRVEELTVIPEAHCYLMCGEKRFDFTGLATAASSPFDSLIEERVVSPTDLPSAKLAYHRGAIEIWARARGMDADRAWAIRERCIALLANSTPHTDACANAVHCEVRPVERGRLVSRPPPEIGVNT